MASSTPSPPVSQPQHNQPPPIASSPPLLTEYVHHHHQFADSISPPWPPQLPENSPDRHLHPPPENADGLQEHLPEHPVPLLPPPEEKFHRQQLSAPPSPPPEEKFERQQTSAPPSPPPEEKYHRQQPSAPPSPPPEEKLDRLQASAPPSPSPTGTERSPENSDSNRESPLSNRPSVLLPSPSQSPATPPTGPEDPVESVDYRVNPNPTSGHESPLSKQPDDRINSPNYRQNPSPSPSSNPDSDHKSPSPASPAKFNENPSPKASESPKNPSPSPPLTTGSPSSPQDTLEPSTALTPPLGVPLLLQAAADFSPNRPQISPWTHQETINLIQAYQEKWYSLKKGPLKAGQWEEVAITVAARCGYDEPTKTAKQCRHKIEKLRKRYRAERGKPHSKATIWIFFKLMDNLEKGPLPISSSPPLALVEYQKPSNSNGKRRKFDDDEAEEDDNDREFHLNKRSSRAKNYGQNSHHSHQVPNGYATRSLRFPDSGTRVVRGLRTPVVHKHKGFYREDDEEDEEEEQQGGENGGEEGGVAAQLAVEIKGFAEKFVKMENKKMEMIRDVERYRLEMENKRMEMILESQQMLVETVSKAFSNSNSSSSNKTHKQVSAK